MFFNTHRLDMTDSLDGRDRDKIQVKGQLIGLWDGSVSRWETLVCMLPGRNEVKIREQEVCL